MTETRTKLSKAANLSAKPGPPHPEARLGAAAGDVLERARLNETLAELVSDVHKAWAPVYVPDRFVTLEGERDSARKAAFGQLDRHYARLDAAMTKRTWVLFGRRTIADAYLYVMATWKDRSPTPLANFPALERFKVRLDADPGVQQALTIEAR